MNVTARAGDLVTEQRAVAALLLRFAMTRRTMLGGAAGTVLACAPAEQLRKQLHGRFPLTETDPPVGQDEP
ncbi:hypothetical protein [Streptomyces sp. SYSU K217416]